MPLERRTQRHGSRFGETVPQVRRIKILHLQLYPMLSGVQRVTLEEFRRLDPDVFDMHLATREDGPLCDAARTVGVTCHHFPTLQRAISPIDDFRTYRRLRDWMRHQRFDIVHTHSSKPGVLGRLAATAADVPVVVHTVHGFAFPAAGNTLVRRVYQLCEARCSRRTHCLICLNPDDQQLAIDDLGMPAERIFRIPNGVDVQAFRPEANPAVRRDRRQRCLPGDATRPLVMMVGRLWRQKNPQAFVRAAIRVIQAGSDAEFCLAGDGELRGELEAMVAEAGISSRVHLLGWRDDVDKLLPLADVLVLPSLWEGMPLVLLEAQACGVPVVASDIAGNRDCVQHERDGFLIPPGDDQHMAERLCQLVADDALRQRLGQAARSKIVSQFDVRSRVDRVIGIYQQLLDPAR